jgi:hypothetical protein
MIYHKVDRFLHGRRADSYGSYARRHSTCFVNLYNSLVFHIRNKSENAPSASIMRLCSRCDIAPSTDLRHGGNLSRSAP